MSRLVPFIRDARCSHEQSLRFHQTAKEQKPDLITKSSIMVGLGESEAEVIETMKESKATVKKEIGFLKKAGAPKSLVKHEESEMKKMAKGGITTAKMGKVTSGGKKPHGEHTVQKKGHTKAMMPKMSGSKPLGMKKGGKC